MKVILRIRNDKLEELKKILADFKNTSESKGESLQYVIDENERKVEISGCKDLKHAYRIKWWFVNKFKDAVIYGMVEKDGQA